MIAAPPPPPLIHTPIAEYAIVRDFVSIGVKVRLARPLAERGRYSVIAAPRLRRGRELPDELFGGGSLGRLTGRRGVWYVAEAAQLRRRHTVTAGARWQVALARSGHVVGVVKTVRLRRG